MWKERKNLRLRGYDYSERGYYFVTVCTENRENLFGDIANGEMILNEFGIIVDKKIKEMNRYINIYVEIFCVMPNHIHMIIEIVGAGPCACPNKLIVGAGTCACPKDRNILGSTRGSTPTRRQMGNHTVGDYIKQFKTMVTKTYIDKVNQNNWPRFNRRLFQRNYFERIIRNETEYSRIKEYIQQNPDKWEKDENYL